MQALELTVGDVVILWGKRIRLTCYVGLISCLAYWWAETLDTPEPEITVVALELYDKYEVIHASDGRRTLTKVQPNPTARTTQT